MAIKLERLVVNDGILTIASELATQKQLLCVCEIDFKVLK